jgi:hypothetical protein
LFAAGLMKEIIWVVTGCMNSMELLLLFAHPANSGIWHSHKYITIAKGGADPAPEYFLIFKKY